jgi:hypothetical protein
MRTRNKTCKKPCMVGAKRYVELKRIRVSSIALRWILAVSLTASPLLAQSAPQSDPTVQKHRAAVRVVDENNNPLVGNTIFSSLLTDSPEASSDQTDTQRNGKELGTPKPAGNPDSGKAEPGGKTMQELVLAALIAGGIVALILLLGGHDHKGTTTAAAPHTTTPTPQETGTVLVPGTPSVGTGH